MFTQVLAIDYSVCTCTNTNDTTMVDSGDTNQSINLYCTPRGRIKNKINEIKYNNTAHIKYTSEKKTKNTHTHHKD